MGREVKGEEIVNVNIYQSGKFRYYCMGREELIGEYLVCINEQWRLVIKFKKYREIGGAGCMTCSPIILLGSTCSPCSFCSNRLHHAAHTQSTISRCTHWQSGRRVYSPGNSICRYWQHSATQTNNCRLLAHTCAVRIKLHWFDLLTSLTNERIF